MKSQTSVKALTFAEKGGQISSYGDFYLKFYFIPDLGSCHKEWNTGEGVQGAAKFAKDYVAQCKKQKLFT